MDALDRLREDSQNDTRFEEATVASMASVATSLSVGYVAWLIRGGALLSSLLSSLPAWRMLDPFPVLARHKGGETLDEDDESLESLVDGDRTSEDEREASGENRAESATATRGARTVITMALNPKIHVAFGLAAMTATLLLGAAALGLIPDRRAAIREGRISLAEAIAAQGTAAVANNDLAPLEATLRLVMKRNGDILSAALRQTDDRAVITLGNHADWTLSADDVSTDNQLQVPLWAGKDRWGQLELRYRPFAAPGLPAIAEHPLVRLVGFVSLVGFVAFYLYLSKVLRHLDPSQAIPARVRSALDTLAEGLLVLDRQNYIVLANQAFAMLVRKVVGRTARAGRGDPARGRRPTVDRSRRGIPVGPRTRRPHLAAQRHPSSAGRRRESGIPSSSTAHPCLAKAAGRRAFWSASRMSRSCRKTRRSCSRRRTGPRRPTAPRASSWRT